MNAFRTTKINWQKKAMAFRLFDAMPLGYKVYYQVQRKITKTIPRPLSPTPATARWFIEHIKTACAHFDGDIANAQFFEFGAGWDLYSNLVLWCYGVEHQMVYDLRRWAKPDQINIVINHLIMDPPPGAKRPLSRLIRENEKFIDDLAADYGIIYKAPADAGNTGLSSESIDFIVTTSVFEHIPSDQIPRLLRECHRLLKPAGAMSHVIDYSDHYAHSDATISPYNFLTFTGEDWAKFNPRIHYQNRLRHAEYATLFKQHGFRTIMDRTEQPCDAEQQLRLISVKDRFRSMPLRILAPTVGHHVLRK